MCPFCAPDASRIVGETPLAFALRDAFPVSPGHTLIVPRRHIASFFDATDDERTALLDLLARMKAILAQEHSPAGYNIGINDGLAAGQTIPHLHIHLIPRYVGDRPDPRGGVRWIFPDRANYWDSEE